METAIEGGAEANVADVPTESSQATPTAQAGKLPTEGDITPPTKEEKKKWKLKIYDEEKEYDEEGLVREAQKAAAANYKFQKAAEMEKARAQWLKERRENPDLVFKDFELDPDEWAEKRLLAKLKLDTMEPNERKAYDLERENASLKKKWEDAEAQKVKDKEASDKESIDRLKSKYAQELETDLPKSLEAAGLKPTARRLARIAELQIAHATKHGKLLSFDKAVEMAEKDIRSDIMDILPKFSHEEIAKMLPREIRDVLRKMDLDELKSQNPLRSVNQKTESTDQPQKIGKKLRMSTDDFFATRISKNR